MFAICWTSRAAKTADVVAEGRCRDIIRSFHWPKSMRWGTGELRWSAPAAAHSLRAGLVKLVAVPRSDGLASNGNQDRGHRVPARAVQRYGLGGITEKRQL